MDDDPIESSEARVARHNIDLRTTGGLQFTQVDATGTELFAGTQEDRQLRPLVDEEVFGETQSQFAVETRSEAGSSDGVVTGDPEEAA